jgi:hypothetical protein
VYSLTIHDDAKDDLDKLWVEAEEAAALIVALLQEIQGDQILLDALTIHNFGADHSADFHISRWLEFWNRGLDLWRLKAWTLEAQGLPYRVVYSYEPRRQRYHVLGVFHRDFNYDRTDQRTQRVQNAYADVCG